MAYSPVEANDCGLKDTVIAAFCNLLRELKVLANEDTLLRTHCCS